MVRAPLILFAILLVFHAFAETSKQTYVWTDLNGQKIEAAFIRADESSVTISMEGVELALPLDSLSPFSKALAIKLRSQSGPNDAPPAVYDWKDSEGRVIRAEFIRADTDLLVIKWEGQPIEILIATLSQESKNLARRLSSSNRQPESPASQPASPPAIPEKKVEGTDPNGEIDPEEELVWISSDGRPLKAKFIDLDGDEVQLLAGLDREIVLNKEQLSESSVLLADKMKKLLDQKRIRIRNANEQRRKMRVPEVEADDLDAVHELKNTAGTAINASFLDANEEMVTLQLQGRSSPIDLAWEKFSPESQALLEALRRKSLAVNPTPKLVSARGGRLGYFANGPFKDFNSVVQTERFDVALSSSGRSVRIWLKNPDDSSVSPKIFGLAFDAEYTDKTNPEKWRKRQRSIKSFDAPPEPSINREKISLKGSFSHGGTFDYNMELNSKGLIFWGSVRDPSSEEWPTRLAINFSVPGIVPDSKNKTMAQIMPFIGDGALYMEPQSGKRRHYPYKEKWTTMNNKYKGQAFSGLKAMTVMGHPYGKNKLTVTPLNGKDMRFQRIVPYGRVFPFQGFSMSYESLENKKEIPKSRALKVLLTGL